MLHKLILALSLFLSMAVAAETAGDDDWRYEVQVDDTIWEICKSYVEDAQCWRKLVEYNNIKTPKYLPPESIVRIPKSWLKKSIAQALVISVRGEVSVSGSKGKPARMLKTGDKLSQADTITAKDGSAMIEFADQSRLLLKPNSAVRMDGLRFYQRGGIANTQIRLLKGRVKASVNKLKGLESRFDIATPAAVAAVRGTEFRVALLQDETQVDGKAVMMTELLEGQVAVGSEQNSQILEAGEAVQAVEGEGVKDPIKLLDRPRFSLNTEEEVTLPHQFQWYPVKGAVKYRLSLTRDDAVLWEDVTSEEVFDIDLEDSGTFILEISAIDQFGFEGRGRRLRISMD